MTNQPAIIPDGLSGWEFLSIPSPDPLSFSLQAESSQTVPVWQVDLPPDLNQADKLISQQEKRVREMAAALESIPQRIDQMMIQGHLSEDGIKSFDAGSTPLLAPEDELLHLLEAIDAQEKPHSFSSVKSLSGEFVETGEQFQAASQRLLRLFSHFAWIDTLVQGRLLGHTEVGWTGSLHTAWAEDLNEAQMNLHQRNLATALASRNASMRILTISMKTALKLSVLLASPGGALLALPVAWKFVNQILNQAG